MNAVADRAFDILVSEAGASGRDREQFRRWFADPDGTEFRFGGHLGFGGKFWKDRRPWRVSCYPEDETPVRQAIVERVNRLLANLSGG